MNPVRSKKSLSALIVSLILVGVLLPVLPTQAQGLPFGGIVSFTVSCTCSGTKWIWFAPLYLGGPTVTTGAIVYSPFSTLLYADLNIGKSGKWHIGDYYPGIQACWIPILIKKHWICIPLPALGLMNKVGTN